MARKPRIEYEGALYHIISRGNQQQNIFFNNRDRNKFLEILKRTKDRYGYILHAYCLMDNHYHLLIETPHANISRIMQNINTSYTVYINKKYKRIGHLLQGRFKAILVDKDSYLLALSRYIHLNPVRSKIVNDPIKYRWSSYREILDLETRKLVDPEKTLSYFSSEKYSAIKKYREFMAQSTNGDDFLQDLKCGFILGNEQFVKWIEQLCKTKKGNDTLKDIKVCRVPIERVLSVVTKIYGDDILKRKRRSSIGRQIGIYLCKILTNAKNNEIGKYFAIKDAAVSVILKKVEDMIHQSEEMKELVKRIRRKCLI